MTKNTKMTKEEDRWRAESDFDTLMSYQKLIKDPERLAAAKKLAKEKQSELLLVLQTKDKKDD